MRRIAAPFVFAAAVLSFLLPGPAAAQTTIGGIPPPNLDCETILLQNMLGLSSATPDAFTGACSQMIHPRWDGLVPMVTLSDNSVLLAGGMDPSGPTNSAELYLPITSTFVPTGNMGKPRVGNTATLMLTGNVLIVGGYNNTVGGPASGTATGTAEVYAASLHLFLPAGAPAVPRYWGHSATLLPNGKVLVAGGQSCMNPCAPLASAELYDPATNKFSPAGPMLHPRSFHAAIALPDGRVLIVGGFDFRTGVGNDTTELYDPVTNRFTAGANTNVMHYDPGATRLADGRILFSELFGETDALEIYNPATGTFQVGGSGFGFPVALLNGKVLLLGSEYDTNLNNYSHVFDPSNGTVVPGGVNTFIGNCAVWPAVRLNNGKVLAYGSVYMGCNASMPVSYNAVLYQQ